MEAEKYFKKKTILTKNVPDIFVVLDVIEIGTGVVIGHVRNAFDGVRECKCVTGMIQYEEIIGSFYYGIAI